MTGIDDAKIEKAVGLLKEKLIENVCYDTGREEKRKQIETGCYDTERESKQRKIKSGYFDRRARRDIYRSWLRGKVGVGKGGSQSPQGNNSISRKEKGLTGIEDAEIEKAIGLLKEKLVKNGYYDTGRKKERKQIKSGCYDTGREPEQRKIKSGYFDRKARRDIYKAWLREAGAVETGAKSPQSDNSISRKEEGLTRIEDMEIER